MIDQAEAPATIRVHRWEVSGFGRAPFRCTGMTEQRHDMGGGKSKPGGTCDYCGQGILYVFNIVSSDGRKFKVGCDCVAHTHDPAERIVAQTKRMLANHKRAKAGEGRAAKAKAASAARQAAWDAEAVQRAAWLPMDALYVAISAHASANSFLASMKNTMERRDLSEAQEAAVRDAIGRIEAASKGRVNSQHIGAVGERVKLAATVEFSKCIYHGTDRYDPSRYLNKLRTADGSAVTWFGGYGLEAGAQVELSASVKEHSEYQGERQTIIRNPRFK